MKRLVRKQKKQKQAQIAKERIERLFQLADKSFNKNPELSNRYVQLARKISMRTNTRLPKKLKRKFCKHCGRYLVPGKNCRIRTKQGKLVCTCLECNRSARMPYLKEKKISKS